jgi:hypothetical protein
MKQLFEHFKALVGYSPGILRMPVEFFKILAIIMILGFVAFALQYLVLSLLYFFGID